MAKTYRCEIQVRIFELDSFGHVNHARYVSYLEHGRWKMLEEEGISLKEFDAWKKWPVIASLEIRYLQPAYVDEVLEIVTTCVRATAARLVWEQSISRKGIPIVEASITAAMVDAQGRPVRLPPSMRELQ